RPAPRAARARGHPGWTGSRPRRSRRARGGRTPRGAGTAARGAACGDRPRRGWRTSPPIVAQAPGILGRMGDAVARPALGTNGAVVAPNHQATTVGLQILRGGGNAVDAAIATNAALSVVSGHSCGLGGDAFWLIWPGDGGPWRRVAQDSGDAPEPADSDGSPAFPAADSDDRVLDRLVGLNGSGRAGSRATIERVHAEGHDIMPMW